MNLSVLQKYILKQCAVARGGIIDKEALERFYVSTKHKPGPKDMATIITRSVERLIKKELITGYGVKTSHKWYIKQVRLTSKGRKVAKALLGIQQVLPLKASKSNKT